MCGTTATPNGYNVGPLRQILQQCIGKTPDAKLQDFIQVELAYGGGNDCSARASSYIPDAWGVRTSLWKTIAPINTFMSRVDKFVNQKMPGDDRQRFVDLQVGPKWGGADDSRFTASLHHVLLIGTGKDIDGKNFCVVYDPDVTATPRSQQAWAACRGLQVNVKAAASTDVVKQMVLGENNNLGGLVRYFYPDCAG